MIIYTISTVQYSPDNMYRKRLDTRCWAYFEELDQAIKAIYANTVILNDGNNWNWAVIESVRPGFGKSFERTEYWFEYNNVLGRFNYISRPDWAKDIVCWGIG